MRILAQAASNTGVSCKYEDEISLYKDETSFFQVEKLIERKNSILKRSLRVIENNAANCSELVKEIKNILTIN